MNTANQYMITGRLVIGGVWLASLSCWRSYVSVVHSSRQLEQCYKLLNVLSSCSDDELRTAYLSLAKLYHPDVNSQTSNAKKFAAIEEAYRMITTHRRDLKLAAAAENPETPSFDIKHTAPQHRQYLDLEGYGFGTPSQRLRQHEQKRVTTAVENVIDYRIKKHNSVDENALVAKDIRETKKRTMRSAIDRLVEDLIAESMAKGEFDNLPGRGKPLPYSHENPYVDSITHNMNKILINNGYAPPWVTLEKEIRVDMMKASDKLRSAYLTSRGQSSSAAATRRHQKQTEDEFRETIAEVNKKINRLNMLVPTLRQQLVHYNADKLLQRIVNDCNSSSIDAVNRHLESTDSNNSTVTENDERTLLKSILKQLKAIFGT